MARAAPGSEAREARQRVSQMNGRLKGLAARGRSNAKARPCVFVEVETQTRRKSGFFFEDLQRRHQRKKPGAAAFHCYLGLPGPQTKPGLQARSNKTRGRAGKKPRAASPVLIALRPYKQTFASLTTLS